MDRRRSWRCKIDASDSVFYEVKGVALSGHTAVKLALWFYYRVQGIALSGHMQRESGAVDAGGDLMREKDVSDALANFVFADAGDDQ